MNVCGQVPPLRDVVRKLRAEGRRIGFVPTMGNLHAGHLKLVDAARAAADAVVVSIYVNPLQFGPQEDLARYPHTPEEDHRLLTERRVDILFRPDDAVMYPRGTDTQTIVDVPGLSEALCGAARPGHFRGVATVVNRLLNLVAPDVAVFGKKDYQQLQVIRRMVDDLAMPVEILGVDTEREADGLALSSRNRYLTASERQRAPALYRTLQAVRDQARSIGAMPALEAAAMARLQEAGFEPEYVSIRRQRDLQRPETGDRDLVVLAAARLGAARLIDNLEFQLQDRS